MHFDLLFYVMEICKVVGDNFTTTTLSTESMALMFNTILFKPKDPVLGLKHSKMVKYTLTWMIHNWQRFFEKASEPTLI